MSNQITNVFVLMLENHSFDHLLGFSGIPGINGLNGTESNTYDDHGAVTKYTVQKPAVDPMTTDPNHEFTDTIEQLCGQGVQNPFPTGPYPPENNLGFAANYATIADESTGLPSSTHIGDVLACCDPSVEVPALLTLAQEFAVCDNWCASIPGPTWPNRLFAMGATSSGLDDTPSNEDIVFWETLDGIDYKNGNLFDLLRRNRLKYRLYNDRDNQFAAEPDSVGGQFAMVGALKHVYIWDIHSFGRFEKDLSGNYPYHYTFIEPNYGNALNDHYNGGSSQHPMDSLAAGDAMIAATYNAIRNSPIWNTSLLIITYDEHGGFYDHVAPGPACAPDDGADYGYNKCGFDFKHYGIRVPAVIVSPLIPKGMVDNTLYDHSSICKTVEKIHGLPALTHRDLHANDVTGLLTLSEPRTDCPQSVTGADVLARPRAACPSDADLAEVYARPLPENGNLLAFLFAAHKADLEMTLATEKTALAPARAAAVARYKAISTRADAKAYFDEVSAKLDAYNAAIANE